MTSSHHGPLWPGLHHVLLNGRVDKGVATPRGGANSHKTDRSPDRSLQLERREVGIASNRKSECHGEYVPGPCTHRPSHHGEWVAPEVASLTAKGDGYHGVIHDWGEVVTRVSRRGTCGWITSLIEDPGFFISSPHELLDSLVETIGSVAQLVRAHPDKGEASSSNLPRPTNCWCA